MKKSYAAAVLSVCFVLSGACAGAQSYRYGDYAGEISVIQEALEELDLYYADITGHYGRKTERAVKLFQKKYGLAQTGVADEETLSKLYVIAEVDEAPVVSESIGPIYASNTTLRRDSSGSAVRKLQEDLDELDYYTGTVTGRYGNLTKEAVRLFQRDHGLSSDGIAGPKTLAKIRSVLTGVEESEAGNALEEGSANTETAAAVNPSVSLDDVSKLNTEVTLRFGSRSGYVTRLQKALTALGYFTDKCDGIFGGDTQDAVKLYQKAKGLTDDGVAGRATLKAINKDIEDGVTASTALVD